MSDAIVPSSVSSISSDSAAADVALVTFANDADSVAAGFTDAPPSEWAFSAHEAMFDGEAIDAMREPDSTGLRPLVAIATFVIAEADLYADAEDALVAMTPAPLAFDIAGIADGAGAEIGMVMWSGEIGENDSDVTPLALHTRGGAGLALHDIASHGVSLDWTDTILG